MKHRLKLFVGAMITSFVALGLSFTGGWGPCGPASPSAGFFLCVSVVAFVVAIVLLSFMLTISGLRRLFAGGESDH